MFKVIEFCDGVQPVPSNWLIGDKECYFPNWINQTKINKAIIERKSPEKDWKSHSIVKVFASAATYEHGVELAKMAEQLSELASKLEEEKKKQHTLSKKRKLNFEDDSNENDDDSDSNNILNNINERNSAKKEKSPSVPPLSRNECNATTKYLDHDYGVQTPFKPNHLESIHNNTPADRSSADVINGFSESNGHMNPRHNLRNMPLPSKSPSSISYSDKYFHITCLRKLNMIIRKVQSLETKIDRLTKGKSVLEVPLEEITSVFPIKSDEELEKFEKDCEENKDLIKRSILLMKGVGGDGLQHILANCLRRLLHDEMALKYSLLGRKSKRIFKNLSLYKVVIGSVRFHKPDATENEVAKIISRWLAQSKSRLTRHEKKT